MVECQVCGEDVLLPFRCSYCSGYFCPDHHLPENHECEELWRARRPVREYTPDSAGGGGYPSSRVPSSRGYSRRVRYPLGMRFSRVELIHLAVGGLLVTAVGVSLVVSSARLGLHTPLPLAVSAALFGLSFMVHELAHKFVAQQRGMWAEFRVYPFGALLTLISLISPIKLIAPGAVVIAGPSDIGDVGKTAVAGPVTNVLLGGVLALVSLPMSGPWALVLSYGALLNAWLALFNLIPFGVLDGHKVLVWNRVVWGVLFGLSLLLLGLALG